MMAKRILVIDDDLDILQILDFILTQAGFKVIICDTGNKAHQIQDIKPDVIILDVRIVGCIMTGAEICTLIESQCETKRILVILISAEPCGAGESAFSTHITKNGENIKIWYNCTCKSHF